MTLKKKEKKGSWVAALSVAGKEKDFGTAGNNRSIPVANLSREVGWVLLCCGFAQQQGVESAAGRGIENMLVLSIFVVSLGQLFCLFVY